VKLIDEDEKGWRRRDLRGWVVGGRGEGDRWELED